MNSITKEWLNKMMIDDVESLSQKQKNFLIGVCHVEHDKHSISYEDMKTIMNDLRKDSSEPVECEICGKQIYGGLYEIITDTSDGSKHCVCNECLKDAD